jgi:hypothetical protein
VRVLAVVAVSAVALALPASGAGAIVVQKGIAGAELHMTKTQVRAKLGAPTRIRSGRNDFGRYTMFFYPRVTVTFQSGSRVTALRTVSPLERTAAGVGVGSSVARVKARVPHVVCSTELGSRQCVVGKLLPGRIVTAFAIKHGRVATVIVGIVLD